MEINLNFVTGIFSIVGSLIVAYLAYIIYKYNRSSAGWLAVTFAFILIIIRRTIGFVTEYGLFPEKRELLKSVENVLLLVISALYIWGFWSIKKNFEGFEILGKKVREKVKAMDKKR